MAAVPISPRRSPWGALAPASRLAPLAVLAVGVDGLLAAAATALLGGGGDAGGDPGLLAATRSVILAATAVALAAAGRLPRLREAGWLVYPILAVGGLKLLADDFRHGRAVTLFIALAAYGTALLVVSRLTRKGTAVPSPHPEP
jgi:hypothetical protein